MDAASSAIGIASRGVRVCNGLLSYYNSWKSYKADIVSTHDCIKDLSEAFELLAKTLVRQDLDSTRSKRIGQSLGSCLDSLEELEEMLHRLETNHTPTAIEWDTRAEIQRLHFPFRKSTLWQLQGIVADLQERFSMPIRELRLDTRTNSRSVSTQAVISQMETAFEYDVLDYAAHNFRLLKLLRSPDGPIECELYHAVLHAEPYEALSYTWGTLELTETVKVNGKVLRLTDNLHAALHHLRLCDRDRVLWIDAICINQKDDAERGHQVERMGDIFRHAARVVIWLGKATAEVDCLMNWLGLFAEPDFESDSAEIVPKDERLCIGMSLLLQRSWFRRVWILQEVANARSAAVCAGNWSVPAPIFARARELLHLTADPHSIAVLGLMLRPEKSAAPEDLNQDLGTLLLKFRSCKASDERDKIYALRGISTDQQDTTELLPDYTLALTSVVYKTVRYLFERKRCGLNTVLDFLASFSSFTVVCLVPPEVAHHGPNLAKAAAIRFDQIEIEKKTSYLCIEQRSTEGQENTDTCYSQLDMLSRRQAYLSDVTVDEIAIFTRSPFEQNVKILLVQSSWYYLLQATIESVKSGYCCLAEFLIVNTPHNREYQEFRVYYSAVLREASASGYEKLVEMLIEQEVHVDGWEYQDGEALYAASQKGHLKVVQMLLKAGADVNARAWGGTALIAASGAGHKKVVKVLLEEGAHVNSGGFYWKPALYVASQKGHLKVVKLLLEAKADVNARAPRDSALSAASRAGYEKVVEVLLKAGADADDLDDSYRRMHHTQHRIKLIEGGS